MGNELLYSNTNENLESIVVGLDVTSKDRILAVGGCGDQVFALLENAGRVIVVDSNNAQIDLIEKRAKLLRDRDYEEFLNGQEKGSLDGVFAGKYVEAMVQSNKKRRELYFEKENRLDRIKDNLDNLEISQGNIFEIAENVDFDKIYLSNVIGYGELFCDAGVFEKLAKRLPENGLIYVSNHDNLCEKRADVLYAKLTDQRKEYLRKMEDWFKTPEPDFLPPELVLDEDLTRRAYKIGDLWHPAVYRKGRPQMNLYSALSYLKKPAVSK